MGRVLSHLIVLLVFVDIKPVALRFLLLRDEEGDDQSIDTARLAQDNTDKILGLNARHLYQGTKNGG